MAQPESYQKSVSFMKQMYKDYYSTNEITLPDRFSRREYAFVFFSGKGMVRHLAFGEKELFCILRSRQSATTCILFLSILQIS